MDRVVANRKTTKQITVGDVHVGGKSPISIQSMTNTNTEDVDATVKQINEIHAAGADLVRVSVPTLEAAKAFKKIKSAVGIPLIADIHFDYKIALAVADSADCLRINPGNIGKENKIKEVIQAAKDNEIPIRIGVNAGSLEKGMPADIAILDLDKPWVVKRENIQSKSKNTAIEDKKLQGKVEKTFLNGKLVFEI